MERFMINTKMIQLTYLSGFIFIVGCFGSSTPSTVPNTLETIMVATMSAVPPSTNITTSTLMPVQNMIIATPTPIKATTPVPPPATRISFLSGATNSIINGLIQPGQVQYYVLNASQGQPMILMANSLNSDVTLSVKTQGGTSMLNPSSRQNTFQSTLPQTEDYYIGVYGGDSPENYTLNIEIPGRLKFEPSTTDIKLNGKTVGGYVVAYIILALEDQKMTINLNSQANGVVLAIYGYTDGHDYLSDTAKKTSYILRLPSTQDYIIEVVPKTGKVVSYDMQLIIK
jgi:hypothetical protein